MAKNIAFITVHGMGDISPNYYVKPDGMLTG